MMKMIKADDDNKIITSAFNYLAIFTHIDEMVIGKGILGVTVGTDVDVFFLFPITCLI